MKRPLNPFEPYRPALPDQFIGRDKEVAELELALTHLQNGRPRNFLITGCRGVGKTSFLDLVRSRASKESIGFNFLVVDLLINSRSTGIDLAKGIERELARAVAAYQPFRDFVKKAWGFAQRIEAGGLSLRAADSQSEWLEIYEAVAEAMCETVSKVCETSSLVHGYDGVLLLLDEVDQASPELDLGTFLKFFSEIMHRRGCHKVALGLAGLTRSREVLLQSHPSSLRIFDELPLDNLRKEEFDELISSAELKVQNGGCEGFAFSEAAKRLLFEFSDGHPHFVHQFGYCAFEHALAKGGPLAAVTEEDVWRGAFDRRGAFDLIGDMYFAQSYGSLESSDLAVEILDFLSESPSRAQSAAELSRHFDCSYTSVASVLKRLCNLSLINEAHGSYRVQYACFAYWLKKLRPQSVS